MFLVSSVIDWVKRHAPPRLAHRIALAQHKRWRTLEPEFYLLPLLVDPARAAIDVGANEGYFSQELSRLTRCVYAFEPLPWLAESLRLKLETNVRLHQVALSDRSGHAEIRTPFEDGTELHGTSTIEQENRLNDSADVRKIACVLARLDSIIEVPVGFIKIDVEGHELAVLKGAVGVITKDRPVFLIESERRHHPEAPEAIFEFLGNQGYKGFFFSESVAYPVESFSVDRHQKIDLMGKGPSAIIAEARAARYINNFLFLPPGHPLLASMDRAHKVLSAHARPTAPGLA